MVIGQRRREGRCARSVLELRDKRDEPEEFVGAANDGVVVRFSQGA